MEESNLQVEEFSSCVGDLTVFYKLLKLEGSVFIWVGTEAEKMDTLTAAFASRLSGTPPAVSTLLGPVGQGESSSLAERLQVRTGLNILLSINLSNDELTFHVEEQLGETVAHNPLVFHALRPIIYKWRELSYVLVSHESLL